MKIILASSSKYRSQLLEKSGIVFESCAPDTDESILPQEKAPALVARLAHSKASALQQRYPAHLIIGADQVADFSGEIIGKPGDHQRATAQLRQLSGKTLNFYTGLCLINTASGHSQSVVVTTPVTYRQLTDTEIEAYLRKDQPYDCAGAFKSEGLGITVLEAIGGTDPNALVGLPLIELLKMLRQEGYNPLID